VRLDVVEGLIDRPGDAVDGRAFGEASEIENRLAALVEELGEGVGGAVGLVAQRLQSRDHAPLEIVIPEQGDIALETGDRREGCGQIRDGIEAADGGQGAVLEAAASSSGPRR
jgi:hypothetical protein